MKFKILEDKNNFLLKRKEILGKIEAEKTPSFEEAKEQISQEMKAGKELVVIKKIDGGFGSKNFSVKAFVYSSKDDLEKIERKPKAKKTPGQPAEAPPAPAGKK